MAAKEAILTEIVLLGAPVPRLEDVGDGGFRVECLVCWDGDGAWWRHTDYEIPALQAYAHHLRTEHPLGAI